ncbi:MAG: hypothetical protein OEQ39_01445 [Gammaproteobacteria bacterium]|nr:hypothetical protein [Gammaproteobacteria bacterium]
MKNQQVIKRSWIRFWGAILCAAMSANVFALSMGDIRVQSFLNERLALQIPLGNVDPSSAEKLEIRLASRQAFDEFGYARLPLLSELEFEVDATDSGEVVINVTSPSVINEPYIAFLLELRTPTARMIKGFAVLLSPDAYELQLARRLEPEARPAIAATAEGSAANSAQTAPLGESTDTIAPAATLSATGTATVSAGAGAITATSPSRYGPVRRGESVSLIANKLALPVSMSQAVWGLYTANAGAFYNSNVNNLRAGTFLDVPTPETLRQTSERVARAALREHTQNWQRRQTAAAPSSALSTAVASTASTATTASSARVRETNPEPEFQLRIASPAADTEIDSELEQLLPLDLAMRAEVMTVDPALAGISDGQTAISAVNTMGNVAAATATAAGEAAGEDEVTAIVGEAISAELEQLRNMVANLNDDLSASEDEVARLREQLQRKPELAPITSTPMTLSSLADPDFWRAKQTQFWLFIGLLMLFLGVILGWFGAYRRSQDYDFFDRATEVSEPPMGNLSLRGAAPWPSTGTNSHTKTSSAELEAMVLEAERAFQDEVSDTTDRPVGAPYQSRPAKFAHREEDEGQLQKTGSTTDLDQESAEFMIDEPDIARDLESVSDALADLDSLRIAAPPARKGTEFLYGEIRDSEIATEVDDSSENTLMSVVDSYIEDEEFENARDLLLRLVEKFPNSNDYRIRLLNLLYTMQDADLFLEQAQLARISMYDPDGSEWEKVRTLGAELVPDHELFEPSDESSSFAL